MSRVSRRDVLRAGLASGGALVVELMLPGCKAPVPVQPTARPGDFVPNAWLRITPDDRIVFTLDRVEMGQGTMTSQAQLVAEELAVDPARLVIELAGANRAYDNIDPQLNVQVTGGSTSVKSGFDLLRRAGATAREMLRSAAARRWGVSLDTCKAENGAVVHAASGKRARYGELATEAAREQAPSSVVLKSPKDFIVIGKPIRRLDARSKVDGSAVYGIDVSVPDMLTAVVVRPPRLQAKLVRFDDKATRAQPGVVDVFAIPQGVAVVANRYWQARRGADALQAEWSAGASWVSSEGLRRSYLERMRRPGVSARSVGSVESAERGAARVIEAVYEFPYLAHAPLEPQNATASFAGGRCEVWAPTQAPGLAQEAVRRITGLAYDRIVIHQTFVGGGFGRRLAQDFIDEAVEIARRVKRPVKVLFSREDEMRHSPYRPMAIGLLRGAIGKDSSITSYFHRVVTQSIAANVVGEWAGAVVPAGVPMAMKLFAARSVAALARGSGIVDPTSVEGSASLAYTIPNIRVECASVDHPVPVGPWRSVGNSHNVYALECFFDELAQAAGKDPYKARRDLLPATSRERGVLDLAAEKIGWATTKPPPGRHRGIAQAMSFNSFCAHAAEVSVHGADVKVHRVVSAVDCGYVVNPDLVRAQIESSIAFGLGAAMKQAITWRDGAVEQGNFHELEPLRLHEMPEVEVHIVASSEPPTGVGEPGLPPIGPAVGNAIFAATGRPVRVLPFARSLPAPPALPESAGGSR